MANHALRSIVAVALRVIDVDSGYIPPTRSGTTNTQTKVLAELKTTPTTTLEDDYWQLADEVIDFFRILEHMPEYKSVMERADGPMYQACIDAAKDDEIPPVKFPFVVQMPHLYGKLKPKPPEKLNPLKTEAKIIQPGEFMGQINHPERFFVKLLRVGEYDNSKGGNLFEIRDRSNNIGFFYDHPERLENDVQLGDCFAMHATPSSHRAAPNGEKHTIFRSVEVVENKGRGGGTVKASDDVTGKFSKHIPF